MNDTTKLEKSPFSRINHVSGEYGLVRSNSGSASHTPQLSVASNESTRRDQSKLLLVALLENYCMLYDQSKEQNQKLFFVLCQHLCRMGIIDSTDFLEELSSVRSSYKRAFKGLVELALDTVSKEGSKNSLIHLDENDNEQHDMQIMPRYAAATVAEITQSGIVSGKSSPINSQPMEITALFDETLSRFRDEFKIMDALGTGAYGRVFHTKNVLDGCHYAVKIIKTPPNSKEDELARSLREVKMLANISHSNVVRYFASWFEHLWLVDGFDDYSDDDYEDSVTANGRSNIKKNSHPQTHSEQANPDIGGIEGMPSSWKSSPSRIPSIDLKTSSAINSSPTNKPKDLILFIQMELCDSTLDVWLKQLNEFKTDSFRRIEEKILYCFYDLLKGVEFIHKKGYIHRDLKPKNLFWVPDDETSININLGGRNGSWKIGDFGLATFSKVPIKSSNNEKLSLGIGTVTYASPEQINPDSKLLYTNKTDIYSLGIILFELLVPMNTAMERALTLHNLREGLLPEPFMKERPKEAALILWMMSKEPSQRPTASEILELDWFAGSIDKSELNEDHTKELNRLKKENLELRNKIKILESQLKANKL